MSQETEERMRVPGWMVLVVAFALVGLVALVLLQAVR